MFVQSNSLPPPFFSLACNKQCSFVEMLSNAIFSTLFLIQGETYLSVCQQDYTNNTRAEFHGFW